MPKEIKPKKEKVPKSLDSLKPYSGPKDAIPKGHRRATVQEALKTNQIKWYGIEPVNEEVRKEINAVKPGAAIVYKPKDLHKGAFQTNMLKNMIKPIIKQIEVEETHNKNKESVKKLQGYKKLLKEYDEYLSSKRKQIISEQKTKLVFDEKKEDDVLKPGEVITSLPVDPLVQDNINRIKSFLKDHTYKNLKKKKIQELFEEKEKQRKETNAQKRFKHKELLAQKREEREKQIAEKKEQLAKKKEEHKKEIAEKKEAKKYHITKKQYKEHMKKYNDDTDLILRKTQHAKVADWVKPKAEPVKEAKKYHITKKQYNEHMKKYNDDTDLILRKTQHAKVADWVKPKAEPVKKVKAELVKPKAEPVKKVKANWINAKPRTRPLISTHRKHKVEPIKVKAELVKPKVENEPIKKVKPTKEEVIHHFLNEISNYDDIKVNPEYQKEFNSAQRDLYRKYYNKLDDIAMQKHYSANKLLNLQIDDMNKVVKKMRSDLKKHLEYYTEQLA